MRKSSFLLALLLLALAPPNAQGRVLKASTAHTGPPTATGSPSLSSSALPPTTAAGPSPLLNAPPVASWQPVPGAQPVTADGTQRSPDMQPRIIDGDTDAQAALFPYAAFVQWRVNATASFRCSGSLVGPSHVLTAAHCLNYEGRIAEPSELRVWVRGQWFSAAAAYPHEGYGTTDRSSQPSNDVGLIALASPCSVAPVRLPEGPADSKGATRQLAVPLPAAGTKVWAAGFGLTEDGDTSDVLRYTDLTVLSADECPAAFTDDFCAGGKTGYTCQGDSGGPIVLPSLSGDVVVGVTSWGPADCRTPYSFYTRVSDHLPWIRAKMALPVAVGAGPGLSRGSGGSTSSGSTSSGSTSDSSGSGAAVSLPDLSGIVFI